KAEDARKRDKARGHLDRISEPVKVFPGGGQFIPRSLLAAQASWLAKPLDGPDLGLRLIVHPEHLPRKSGGTLSVEGGRRVNATGQPCAQPADCRQYMQHTCCSASESVRSPCRKHLPIGFVWNNLKGEDHARTIQSV